MNGQGSRSSPAAHLVPPNPIVGIIPSGGLGFGVLRSVATLGVVRGKSVPDLLEHPIDGALELAMGAAARGAAGRLATSVTRSLGLAGTPQRAAIFLVEALAEGFAFHMYERHVNRRRPRRARGYLKPRFGDVAGGVMLTGASAAGVSWASRESKARLLILPFGSILYCYLSAEKLDAISRNGFPNDSYLTSVLELSRPRICDQLALPGNPDHVAHIRTLWPILVRHRPIAADFGRLGGGQEFITQSRLPRWMFRIERVERLADPAQQAAPPPLAPQYSLDSAPTVSIPPSGEGWYVSRMEGRADAARPDQWTA